MDKENRGVLERATQRARKLLSEDFISQLESRFGILPDGHVVQVEHRTISPIQQLQKERLIAALEHMQITGMNPRQVVSNYVRDAAFTCLNRFVALRMLEARGLVQECISDGQESAGYKEFCGLAPGIAILPDNAGYQLYIECLFDELSTDVKVLFDRGDSTSVLWPKRTTLEGLLAILNAPELHTVWGEDEAIGWVYQYFNSTEERRAIRGESQTPRNGRELAVRNQFFTPNYVVRFLADNTLGCIWYQMRSGNTRLAQDCEYMVLDETSTPPLRERKDPRDIRVLDPACGSGHFLLYAFNLLMVMYEEAWQDSESPASSLTGHTLREDYPDLEVMKRNVPSLILRHNLHGVDIDPRCAQIAQLALWMRAQTAYQQIGLSRVKRPTIARMNVVIAEPVPIDGTLVHEIASQLDDSLIGDAFVRLIEKLKFAGDLGILLRIESLWKGTNDYYNELFTPTEDVFRTALESFLAIPSIEGRLRRRLFADDLTQGIGLLELTSKRYDVVLMNPPFGASSLATKKEFERGYPKSKGDICAAFVERGIELLYSHGRIGAITSRTPFFLTTMRKWREQVILAKSPPILFADLGAGVLDSAMVETAAYCLEVTS